jgi:hypothetical protein
MKWGFKECLYVIHIVSLVSCSQTLTLPLSGSGRVGVWLRKTTVSLGWKLSCFSLNLKRCFLGPGY